LKKILSPFVILAIVVVTGCVSAPQQPISLSPQFYSAGDQEIGVYLTDLPKTDTHLVGAACLLCYAVAAAANTTLTNHIQSLDTSEFNGFDDTVATLITTKGSKAKAIKSNIDFNELPKFKTKEPNFAKHDFRKLKEELGIDKLIVIDINMAGVYRPYSNYIPTGAPVGTVAGITYTVDLETNKYEQYQNIDFKVGAQKWDEPPAFPGITNAYYEAVELSKDKISNLFK
jgi:hypothetical protein